MTKYYSSEKTILETINLINSGSLTDFEKMTLQIEICKLHELSKLTKIKDLIIQSHNINEKHLKDIVDKISR
ncbi:hypothetical protein JEZ13_10570 [bacterium]|nr:hypothetical protein [bacterium]